MSLTTSVKTLMFPIELYIPWQLYPYPLVGLLISVVDARTYAVDTENCETHLVVVCNPSDVACRFEGWRVEQLYNNTQPPAKVLITVIVRHKCPLHYLTLRAGDPRTRKQATTDMLKDNQVSTSDFTNEKINWVSPVALTEPWESGYYYY